MTRSIASLHICAACRIMKRCIYPASSPKRSGSEARCQNYFAVLLSGAVSGGAWCAASMGPQPEGCGIENDLCVCGHRAELQWVHSPRAVVSLEQGPMPLEVVRLQWVHSPRAVVSLGLL